MPFDWKNPLGFSIAIVLQLAMVSFTLRYMSYMVSLEIGLYSFGILLINGSRDSVLLLNEMIRNQAPRSELKAHVCESVRLSHLKWWFIKMNFNLNKLGMTVLSKFVGLLLASLIYIKQHWQWSFWVAPLAFVLPCSWSNCKLWVFCVCFEMLWI